MDFDTILFILVFAAIGAAVGAWIANLKSRDPMEGGLLGGLLGPIGWIVEVLLSDGAPPPKRRITPKSGQRKCPFCAELIQAEAVVCRYCQRDLPAYVPPVNIDDEIFKSWKRSK